MKALTINELKRLCEKEILFGNGDNYIMVSDDDECNGYHYLWSGFITVKEYEKPFVYQGEKYDLTYDFCSENISNKDNTIILS